MTATPDTPKRRRGPGRPFKPGQSGNPAGCRTGSRNRQTLALDMMAQGEAEAVLRVVVDAAKAGDLRAAEVLLARIWPQGKGRPLPVALPPIGNAADVLAAHTALVAAMGDGRISVEEAAAVCAALEAARRAIMTVDHEARITALEAMA